VAKDEANGVQLRAVHVMGERLHVAPSHVARQPSWGVTGQRWPADGGAGSGWVEHGRKRVKTYATSHIEVDFWCSIFSTNKNNIDDH
jgi:hypothetical protein